MDRFIDMLMIEWYIIIEWYVCIYIYAFDIQILLLLFSHNLCLVTISKIIFLNKYFHVIKDL